MLGAVLIFGFGPGKAKDLGPVVETTCPSCHNRVFLHHVRSKKSFRLYFVPVVPYGTDEYLLCPVCNRGLQLAKDQVGATTAMRDLTARYQAGQVNPDTYTEQAATYWRQLGLAPAAPTEPAPAPTAPAPSGAASPPPAPAASPPPDPFAAASERDWVAQLDDLERLHREGVLSDDQFAAAKSRLLGE